MAIAPGKPLSPVFLPAAAAAAAPANDWTRFMLGDGSYTINDRGDTLTQSGYAFAEDSSETLITLDRDNTSNSQTEGSTRNGLCWYKRTPKPVGAGNIQWTDSWSLQLMVIVTTQATDNTKPYIMVGCAEGDSGSYRNCGGGFVWNSSSGPQMKLNKSGDVNGYYYGGNSTTNAMCITQISHYPPMSARGLMVASSNADGSTNVDDAFAAWEDVMSGSGAAQDIGVGVTVGLHATTGTGTTQFGFRAYYKFDFPASGYQPTS